MLIWKKSIQAGWMDDWGVGGGAVGVSLMLN